MTREEALNVANEMHQWLKTDREREALEFLVPELKESEDDRIRHALIEFLREAYSRGNAPEECAKWLVWLNRPKEQKAAEWDELQAEFTNINEAFEDGKKEVVAHPEKYGLCKPTEWDEEDSVHLANAILSAEGRWGTESRTAKWLKSLRPQPKAEWNEEEKGILLECVSVLQNSGHWVLADKLLSLCPQSHWKPSEVCYGVKGDPDPAGVWKPSDEQVKWLKDVIETVPMTCRQQLPLELLYNDLLKLM